MNNIESGMKRPSWWVSLIPFIVLVAVLVLVIKAFAADALEGGSQVALMFAAGVTVAIAMVFYNIPWRTLEDAMVDNLKSVGTSVIILLLIGAVAGSWMISGVVPTLIYYGMKVILPGIFLFASCLISAVIAIMTGSSWTTIATIGVALVGIGTAHGFDPGWTAGAIISGAYFGDKVSPLSDTTVLASSSAGTSLFTHIRFMMITTIPSFLISLAIFLVASILHQSPDAAETVDFSMDLASKFNISPWLLLVPLLTGLLIAKKVPAIITLFAASVIAGVFAFIFQPHVISEVAVGAELANADFSFIDGFKGLMQSYYGATSIVTGNPDVDSLIATRGMTGMLNTVFLIIAASTFGGALVGSGMLQSLTDALVGFVRRRVSMVAATVGTGIFANMITGDQYLSIILTSNLYKKLYKERRYESKLLSRSVEDSATVVSVLIPWNSCGMTQATVLKVSTLHYLPYCFFNILSPFMSIFIAMLGYKIKRTDKVKKE